MEEFQYDRHYFIAIFIKNFSFINFTNFINLKSFTLKGYAKFTFTIVTIIIA